MARIIGNRITGRFTVACRSCGNNTSTTYAKRHLGQCKACTTGIDTSKQASREEQQARYLDCGPAAWDDR